MDEPLRVMVEGYVRENPGVSHIEIRSTFGDSGVTMANRLYSMGVLRSWYDRLLRYSSGCPSPGYRYAHVLTPRDEIPVGWRYLTVYERTLGHVPDVESREGMS